jgi:hypothetical protein
MSFISAWTQHYVPVPDMTQEAIRQFRIHHRLEVFALLHQLYLWFSSCSSESDEHLIGPSVCLFAPLSNTSEVIVPLMFLFILLHLLLL